MGQSLTDEQRARLREIEARMLAAWLRAEAQSGPVTETQRQRGCVELDWELDAPHTQYAETLLNVAMDGYARGKRSVEDVGLRFNLWLDAHRIQWRAGIPTIFRRAA